MTENETKSYTTLVTDLNFPPRKGGYAKGNETREQILHAALRILVDEGYRAMSMRRVAAECRLRLGNLTYHFPTREDLVQELLDAVISSYEAEFDLIVHDSALAPRERLERYCRLVLEDITSKKTTRLFPELWALSNHDAFVLDRVQELYQRARRPLLEIVQAMRPDLGAQDQEMISLFISAAMEGATPFAGHEKPFEPQMASFERVSIHAFVSLVESYQAGR